MNEPTPCPFMLGTNPCRCRAGHSGVHVDIDGNTEGTWSDREGHAIDSVQWCCADCGSTEGFREVAYHDGDFDSACNACNSVNTGELVEMFRILVGERNNKADQSSPATFTNDRTPVLDAESRAEQWSKLAMEMVQALRFDYAPGALSELDGPKAIRALQAERDALRLNDRRWKKLLEVAFEPWFDALDPDHLTAVIDDKLAEDAIAPEGGQS